MLRQRAHRSPERAAYVFLHNGETEEARLRIGEVDRRARVVAAALQRLHAKGERALLLYPTGAEFVAAFFGCLYSGVIAVPMPPLGPGRFTRALPRLRAIVRDAQARLVLTTSRVCALLPEYAASAPELAALRWIATDELPSDRPDAWTDPRSDAESTAFLQYTSGSTADPKGVAITHANILHNEDWIQRRFQSSEQSIGVSWLPLYHDMGLIGTVLGTLYVGGMSILMSPESFLQQPIRWLNAIARYRAHISGGPNFAFEHCAARITPEQRATLDLSCWQLAYVGAEPVRVDTLERFAKTFEPCGFRGEALYPCYGLAESTLLASSGTRGVRPITKTLRADDLEQGQAVDADASDPPERTRRAASCGRSLDDQQAVIVDPESLTQCRPGQVGEIWVTGSSIARGYWNRPEETQHTFEARLAGSNSVFLRTGDLGFMDDDEIFVTGRLKDLIIIDGKNHYPQDIEQTVEAADPALQPGGCAAFGIEVDGEERLVILAEVRRRQVDGLGGRRMDDAVLAVRRVVADVHGVEAHAIRLLAPGGVLKTSSGKLRRRACRDAFLNDALSVVGAEAHV
jgi:acyl-CoA synthetase (AMP-forming)/AMP-acid ligase II